MNIELLKKVKDHILEEPKRLDMSYGVRKSAVAPCGTAGCIAGWAAILSGRIVPKDETGWVERDELLWARVADIATEELKLSAADTEKVFFVSGWPERFQTQYHEADWNDFQVRAEATAARIQHLIDTGE